MAEATVLQPACRHTWCTGKPRLATGTLRAIAPSQLPVPCRPGFGRAGAKQGTHAARAKTAVGRGVRGASKPPHSQAPYPPLAPGLVKHPWFGLGPCHFILQL